MDANKLSRLIQIADRLKAIREGEDYTAPNQILAYLLQHHFGGEGISLRFVIETQDSDGAYPDEVYYDILVLYGASAEESLCIPVPIVDSWTIISLYKQGVPQVERPDHRRIRDAAKQGERESLLEELFTLVPKGELEAAASKFLNLPEETQA